MKLKVAVLTSGGDSPGMNAAIRAITLAAYNHNLRCDNSKDLSIEVIGIRRGYKGLCEESLDYEVLCPSFKNTNELDSKTCEQISYSKKIAYIDSLVKESGTFLKTARYPELKCNPEACKHALENIDKEEIDVLIVIGGNGSYNGAKLLVQEHIKKYKNKRFFNCICLPATIDNDVHGTQYTIGFHSALDTVLKSLDNVKATAAAHERIMLVEVMGRYCGALALYGTMSGADSFVIAETLDQDITTWYLDKKLVAQGIQARKEFNEILREENFCNVRYEEKLAKWLSYKIANDITKCYKIKNYAVVLIAEKICDLESIKSKIRELCVSNKSILNLKDNNECPIITERLGYIQRGCMPVSVDRKIAAGMGYEALQKAICLKYHANEDMQSSCFHCIFENEKISVQELTLERTTDGERKEDLNTILKYWETIANNTHL